MKSSAVNAGRGFNGRKIMTKRISHVTRALAMGVVAALVIVSFAVTGMAAPVLSNSGGGSWQYYKEITISNSGGALSDYQVLVQLSSSNFPTNARSDGADVRFTDNNGNELSYWIESWDYSGRSAKIWAKVSSIAGGGTASIRMYYGNPSAGSSSNGANTYEFFDDFSIDTIGTTWITDGGSWSINGGVLSGNVGSGTFGALKLKNNINFPSKNVVFGGQIAKTASGGGAEFGYYMINYPPVGKIWDAKSWYRATNDGNNNLAEYRYTNPDTTQTGSIGYITPIINQYYILNTRFSQAKVDLFVNDGFVGTLTNELSDTDRLYFEFYAWSGGAGKVDYVYVRKYTSSEPTLTLSAEQPVSTPTPTPTPTITQTLTPTPTPTPTTGSISVSSTPSGASVYLDNIYEGTTPKTISEVAAGSHYIELNVDSYKPWSESVYVAAGSTSYISAPLVLIPPTTTKTPTPTPTESSITQAPISTKTTPIITEPLRQTPIPTPSEDGIDLPLYGGALLTILLIGVVVMRMRKPKESVHEAPEEPISREKPYQKGINITSAFGYKGATVLYKVKIENTFATPIADIKISLFVPNVFLLMEKQKSLALLKVGESKTVTFEIRPTGECGDCEVTGKVTYYETGSNRTKEIEIGSKMLSIVCPMLKVKEISESEWHNMVSNLLETEESTKEIDMPAETLFMIVSRIIKDMHMHMLKPETTQSQQLFNGVARFYGEGVKGLRYAAQVEVVGGAKKSKLLLKAWAEKEDALTGFYHGILDEIEKRVNVKGYIDDSIVQQYIHIGDRIGTQVKDSVVQHSNFGVGARKCPNCGKEVEINEKFCGECGERF